MSITFCNTIRGLSVCFVIAGMTLIVAMCGDPDASGGDSGRVSLTVNDTRLSVRPLLTKADRMEGVVRAGRLAAGEGVLFVYPRPTPELYWSNRTVLDQRLDVAFLDKSGRVVFRTSMAPDSGNIVRSGGTAQFILIVPDGWFRSAGVQEGTVIPVPDKLTDRAERVSANRDVREVRVDDATARVEVAASEAERARGLMNRKTLAADHGMLFVYPSPRRVQYYMKNTLVPLDVAFIESSGRIHAIRSMTPLRERQVSSGANVSFVLEMRRGWFRRNGITAGDSVDLSSVSSPSQK